MIQQIFEGIANTIIRRPKLVACLIIALFCIGFYGMTLLTMQTGWETYLDKDTPCRRPPCEIRKGVCVGFNGYPHHRDC